MSDENVNFFDLDDKNKQRSVKNILSKKKLSKYELDQIFAGE